MSKPRQEQRIAYLDDDSLERRAFWLRHGMSAEQARRPAETLCRAMFGEATTPGLTHAPTPLR